MDLRNYKDQIVKAILDNNANAEYEHIAIRVDYDANVKAGDNLDRVSAQYFAELTDALENGLDESSYDEDVDGYVAEWLDGLCAIDVDCDEDSDEDDVETAVEAALKQSSEMGYDGCKLIVLGSYDDYGQYNYEMETYGHCVICNPTVIAAYDL